MKKYYLLICLFATGIYAVAQPWTKNYDRVDACNCGLAIPMLYTNAHSFADGFASVCNQKGKWGYIDKAGKEVIPYRYNYATSFAEGVARVLINTTWHTIDKEGNITKTFVMQ